MIAVAITDIHGDYRRLAEFGDALAAADVVLLTGDLTQFGHRRAASEVLDAVRGHNENVLAVAGNCDYPDVGDFLAAEDVNLDGRCRVIEDVALLGLGGSLPAPGRTPNERDEAELADRLEAAASEAPADLPWVLVSHQPPLNTCADRVHGGQHVGSRSVRAFIEEHQPVVCLTGHIHEGRGTDSIGETTIVNPGPLRSGHYARIEVRDGLKSAEIRGEG